MQNITETMSTDHRRCDDLFTAAETSISQGEWSGGVKLFADFRQAMEHHFAMEETILFPAFEQRTGQTLGPTEVMRMEHAQMRELFAEMQESIEQRDQDAHLGASETLLIIMQQHNAKEEQMLYRMADQVLSDQVPEVVAKLQAL